MYFEFYLIENNSIYFLLNIKTTITNNKLIYPK